MGLEDSYQRLKEHRCALYQDHETRPKIQATPAFGEPIRWVETARYLGVTLDTQLTWLAHINQVQKKAAQRLGLLSPLLNRRGGLSITNGVLLYKLLIHHMMDYACSIWGPLPTSILINCKCCNPSVFALRLTHPGTLVTSKSMRIWRFYSLPTISEH
jgi:hypothetical protein